MVAIRRWPALFARFTADSKDTVTATSPHNATQRTRHPHSPAVHHSAALENASPEAGNDPGRRRPGPTSSVDTSP